MKNLELIPLKNYPYHLSWEELKNPEHLLKNFLEKHDLAKCRLLLRKAELAFRGDYTPPHIEQEELQQFLDDMEKLIEAVYVINLLQ